MIKIKGLNGNAFDLLNCEFDSKWLISIDDCDEDLDILDVTMSDMIMMKVNQLTKSITFDLTGRKVMIDTNEFKEITVI